MKRSPFASTSEPSAKYNKTEHLPQTEMTSIATFLVQRHSAKARIPTRGSALAAGYDLYR